jgi:hypothetical protein
VGNPHGTLQSSGPPGYPALPSGPVRHPPWDMATRRPPRAHYVLTFVCMATALYLGVEIGRGRLAFMRDFVPPTDRHVMAVSVCEADGSRSWFQPGISGNDLRSTILHEGVHLEQMARLGCVAFDSVTATPEGRLELEAEAKAREVRYYESQGVPFVSAYAVAAVDLLMYPGVRQLGLARVHAALDRYLPPS